MEKVLIFGRGQIAHFYLNHYNAANVPAQIAENVDITVPEQVNQAIADYQPTVVINAAAKTNLEWCGNNRAEAFNVNCLGAANIAAACDKAGVYFIHLSSGCIFSSTDGTDAKKEDDAPAPASYYAWTKVWSEELVMFERSADFKCLILRPRQPVSTEVNAKNMLVKMLTFAKFIDTANSGTVIEDLMGWTDALVAKRATGVYHVANTGFTTPYDIGLLIKKYIMPDLEPEKISKAELDKLTPNTRVDTVLDVSKLQALGVEVTPYQVRLEAVVKQLGENIAAMDKDALQAELEKTAAATRERSVTNDVFPNLCKA
jgi:dTDP-4-dehydrorhamnose reductase